MIYGTRNVFHYHGMSLVVSVFKGTRSDCSNHCEINLLPIVTKVLALIVRRRFSPVHESKIRKKADQVEVASTRYPLFDSWSKRAMHVAVLRSTWKVRLTQRIGQRYSVLSTRKVLHWSSWACCEHCSCITMVAWGHRVSSRIHLKRLAVIDKRVSSL